MVCRKRLVALFFAQKNGFERQNVTQQIAFEQICNSAPETQASKLSASEKFAQETQAPEPSVYESQTLRAFTMQTTMQENSAKATQAENEALCVFSSLTTTDESNFQAFKKRVAFTMIELLMSLFVVGLIASLVVPSAIEKYQTKVFERAYDTEVQGVEAAVKSLIVNENTSDFKKTSMYKSTKPSDYKDSAEKFLKDYFKVSEMCKNSRECFAKGYYEYKDKDKKLFSPNFDGSCAKLKNGMSICIVPQIGDTRINGIIDLNGTKGPNVYGRDFRSFNIEVNSRTGEVAANTGVVYEFNFEPMDICEGRENDIDCCKSKFKTTLNTPGSACCQNFPQLNKNVCCKKADNTNRYDNTYCCDNMFQDTIQPGGRCCLDNGDVGARNECSCDKPSPKYNNTYCCRNDSSFVYDYKPGGKCCEKNALLQHSNSELENDAVCSCVGKTNDEWCCTHKLTDDYQPGGACCLSGGGSENDAICSCTGKTDNRWCCENTLASDRTAGTGCCKNFSDLDGCISCPKECGTSSFACSQCYSTCSSAAGGCSVGIKNCNASCGSSCASSCASSCGSSSSCMGTCTGTCMSSCVSTCPTSETCSNYKANCDANCAKSDDCLCTSRTDATVWTSAVCSGCSWTPSPNHACCSHGYKKGCCPTSSTSSDWDETTCNDCTWSGTGHACCKLSNASSQGYYTSKCVSCPASSTSSAWNATTCSSCTWTASANHACCKFSYKKGCCPTSSTSSDWNVTTCKNCTWSGTGHACCSIAFDKDKCCPMKYCSADKDFQTHCGANGMHGMACKHSCKSSSKTTCESECRLEKCKSEGYVVGEYCTNDKSGWNDNTCSKCEYPKVSSHPCYKSASGSTGSGSSCSSVTGTCKYYIRCSTDKVEVVGDDCKKSSTTSAVVKGASCTPKYNGNNAYITNKYYVCSWGTTGNCADHVEWNGSIAYIDFYAAPGETSIGWIECK